jgi:transposase-like protein
MTASQAAAELGVSRKTYYKWEQRGLAGLLDGVADQAPGRPENPDTTTEQNLKKQLAELKNENQLLEQKMALKLTFHTRFLRYAMNFIFNKPGRLSRITN